MAPPRDRPQRLIDALARLESDLDVWVATAGSDGTPYLVPLSLDWDGAGCRVRCPRESHRREPDAIEGGAARHRTDSGCRDDRCGGVRSYRSAGGTRADDRALRPANRLGSAA